MIENQEILGAYQFRHACKIFDADKKISETDFNTILETARLSPSSFGFEPWRFLIVQDMKLREKLKPIIWGAQGTLPTASHFVVVLARKAKGMRYDSKYIDHMMFGVHKLPEDSANGRRNFYKTFQESDFDLLGSDRAMFDWATKQTYIALGNMMTTAAMLGIDSCPIEGFKIDSVEKLLEEEFDINTEEFGVAVMVSFGYRIDEQPPKTRQKLEDITQWYN
ncbi:NAD(P)H-dependent oxidoreductase [Sulfurovum sp. CS9]|uniref:NAD(P)H-dependent oxidoreductase n=1 Tax=Sulfurovum sp. CS9 TaxID=3391146 RepID=UPI0039EC1619